MFWFVLFFEHLFNINLVGTWWNIFYDLFFMALRFQLHTSASTCFNPSHVSQVLWWFGLEGDLNAAELFLGWVDQHTGWKTYPQPLRGRWGMMGMGHCFKLATKKKRDSQAETRCPRLSNLSRSARIRFTQLNSKDSGSITLSSGIWKFGEGVWLITHRKREGCIRYLIRIHAVLFVERENCSCLDFTTDWLSPWWLWMILE